MINITALIILYNARPSESDTLRSIFSNDLSNVNLSLIVWNNGPALLSEDDVGYLTDKSKENHLSYSLYQDLRNISLPRIYNFFIDGLIARSADGNEYDYLLILDQDSILKDGFFAQIVEANGYELLVPKIFLEKDRHLYQTHPHREEDAIFTIAHHGMIEEKFHTCMSGAALSRALIKKLRTRRQNIFDERLGLYYSDTEFFIFINKLIDSGETISRYCAGEIIHDSFQMNGIFDREFKQSNPRFAELQIVNLYNDLFVKKKHKILLYKNIISGFIRRKKHFSKDNVRVWLKFIRDGKHERSKYDISASKPTHQYHP